MSDDREYVIRMPDGTLWGDPARCDPMKGWSPGTGHLAFGSLNGPTIWNSLEHAESALAELRERAAKLGVHNWEGTILQRSCSPFTSLGSA